MKRRSLFILITFLLAAQLKPAKGQPFHLSFQYLTTVDGLPSDNITALLQDSQGFIWIGTNEGLVRYDGSEMKVYKSNENPSWGLVTNMISRLYEDLDSNLVIDHNGRRLTLYDPKTESRIFRDTFLLELYNTKLYASANTRRITLYDPVLDSIAKSGPDEKTDQGRFLGLKNGTSWVIADSRLLVFNEKTQQASEFSYTETNRQKRDFTNVELLREDHLQGVWLLNNGDLIRYDPSKKMFETIFPKLQGTRILFDSKGRVWFSHNGLYVYDLYTKKLTHFQSDPNQLNGLSSNNITALLEDDEGRIWVGTQGEGINIFDPYLPNYQYVLPTLGDPSSLSGNNIPGVLETEKGLWVDTGDGYINYLDFETNTTKKYPIRLEKSKPRKFRGPILKDEKGHIYVCDWLNYTMYYFDEQLGEFKKCQPDLPFELSEFMFLLPFIDSKGFYYYHSHITAGVFPDYNNKKYIKLCPLIRYHPETGEVKTYYAKPYKKTPDSLRIHFINGIGESSVDGSIWIGTRNGLSRFDPREEKFEHFFHDSNDKNSLSSDNVFAPYEDSHGNLWISHGIAGGGGLSKIPVEALESDSIYFERIHTGNSNLPSNFISKFHEDRNGYLWLITQMGPSRYDYKTNEFQSFKWPLKNKITVNYFWSSFGESGKFHFGTSQGLFSFHPDSVPHNLIPPRIRLTNILINNQKVPIKGTAGDTLDWETPLEKSILFTKKIKLPYWQNDFFFDFTAINFTYGKDAVYQYQLDNYDNKWKTATADRSEATYTNMPPGKYTFRVKAANHSGTENTEDALLHITITPPWYWNIWSITIYLFFIFLFIYWAYRYQLNRKLAIADAKRLRELDTFKTQLYTNITHEFRTPLTVILGMADQIEAEPEKWFKEGLRMIRRNSQNLLSLVNQMLDLRKLESGSLTINMVQADVIPYLKYLLESFHSYAESKDIRVHFISSIDECIMDYDPDKLQQIVSNLMSNAIKFTKRGGNVYLIIDKGEGRGSKVEGQNEPSLGTTNSLLNLKIKDTGVGIPQEKISNIFDRFYQVDDTTTREREGTGIGLSLTKALVQLLGGQISVKSNADPAMGGTGSEFTVQLPVTNQAPAMDTPLEKSNLTSVSAPVMAVPQKVVPPLRKEELPLVLIVEDNADVVQYLITCLGTSYQIEVAQDGKEGIDKALELTPDILISDVMMPRKDGFQLTEKLKTDIRTSHIPIILLTAKADMESRIKGLKRGADAYLPKPFNRKELLIRLQKLIELRKNLRKHYLLLAGEKIPPESMEKTLNEDVMEQHFVQRARQVVDDNLTNYDFKVSDLHEQLNMSHSNLHRKLKQLLGLSANEFIHHVRLQKAKHLLRHTNEPVSNIAFDTGYKDPGHFSRVFKKAMGLSPSEYRQRK